MWSDLGDYASDCCSQGISYGAFEENTGKLVAFALVKLFKPNLEVLGGALDDLLARCQGALPNELLQTKLLHVAIIGRIDNVPGIVKSVTRVALENAAKIGFTHAFAETSSPASTALCVSCGGSIVKTIFYKDSPFEHLRTIPLWEDRNKDVATLPGAPQSVQPSIRLVTWDLR